MVLPVDAALKAIPLSSQRFPFFGPLVAAIAGILLVSELKPVWWVSVAPLIILPLVLVDPLRKRGGVCWALTFLIFALLHFWSWSDAPGRKLAEVFESPRSVEGTHAEGSHAVADPQGGEFVVRGVITGEPKRASSGRTSFPMRVEEIQGLSDGFLVTAPVTVLVGWEGEPPAYGDRVSFQAHPERFPPPPNPGSMDYRRWLERHGIYTEFRIDPSIPGRILEHDVGNPLFTWALGARHWIEAILSTDLPKDSPELSAIKGITLGVTENAPDGFTDDFRFTGTMHLFAVSGLHVGMLAVIVWFVLKLIRVPRLWGVAMTIPILFFYVVVTGMKMGSIRSATMASILLCGFVLFRRSPLLNTLAASAFLQLAWDTNSLFSAGWQFSYSVVLAILIIAAPVEHWLCHLWAPDPFIPPIMITPVERFAFSTWKHVAGLVAVSASAWVGSLIPTVAYFHLISLSAFGANLLAVPLAFLVLSLGALSLMSGCFSLWIAGAFNNANWLVTKLLLVIVQGSAMIPGGHWFVGSPHASYPEMTILDLRRDSCAVIRSHGEFALINAGGKRSATGTILPFLESSGVNSLKDVLITKADAADVGGLPTLARELKIGRIGIPRDSGRSSVAKSVLSTAKGVQQLYPGMSWPILTDVTAEILSSPSLASKAVLPTRLSLGELRVLLLPRLSPEVMTDVLALPQKAIRSDILVVPLGGSAIVSMLEVIRRIAPRVIISPVDRLDRNGFPSREWNSILSGEGIYFLRQDEEGAITIKADPKNPMIHSFLQSGHAVSLSKKQATPL